MPEKENYARDLSKGTLDKKTVNNLIEFMRSKGMSVEKLHIEILKKIGFKLNIEFFECRGYRSWEGLIVTFPGTRRDLSTINVGTPFLRKILYPMLVLHRELRLHYSRPMPCLYLLGERFNDVFLRKFGFLKSLVPRVIVMSGDLMNWKKRKAGHIPTAPPDQINEYYFQKSLCERMNTDKGLLLPLSSGEYIHTGLLSYEVPTVASAEKTERMDILGYDREDHSLVVFEIKGPDANQPELQNLFFQGMEHRNWLEENKMAVKFAREGPKGIQINTKKRVKLMLGFCGEKVPELFLDLKSQALRKDRSLQIGFCRFVSPLKFGSEVRVEGFDE